MVESGFGMTPLLLGLVAIAVGVGLFFAVNDDDDNDAPPVVPVSPS